MAASRRLGVALPSRMLVSLPAFVHDRSSRCRAARMNSRQQRRPNRAFAKSTNRFSVHRVVGSTPVTEGAAASCRVARTASPSAASIRQKGLPPVPQYSLVSKVQHYRYCRAPLPPSAHEVRAKLEIGLPCQGSNTVLPVVLRASKARWASAASFKAKV